MPIRANQDQKMCYYPLCTQPAAWTPIFKIPTCRTNGAGKLVKTDRPTVIVLNNICDQHKQSYSLPYWIPPNEWRDVVEEGKKRGFTIPLLEVMPVEFIPLGDAILHSGYLEMNRE